MYCKNCGAQINDDAVFCEKCGAKQTSIQTAKPVQNEVPKAVNNSKKPEEIIQDFDGNIYAAARFLSERDRISMNEAKRIIRKAKKQLPKTAVQSDRSNHNVPYDNLDEAFRNRIKKALIIGGFLILVLCIVSTVANRFARSNRSSDTITTTQNTTRSTTKKVTEKEMLRNELKEKYGIHKPLEFHEDFSTDEFRYVVISDSTPPSDYAVKYVKAYMDPGDIHYICNLFLNTTTKIWFEDLLLENGDYTINVTVHQYEKLEEMDIHSIGRGMLLTEAYYSYNTGEEFTVDIDESADSVSSEELVKTVKTIVTETYDEIIDRVTFDDKNLYLQYNYSKAYSGSPFLNATEDIKKQCAEGDCGDIASTILDLDDQYTNTWQTITIDCGSLGKAVFDKSMIVNHGYGNYFDYVDGDLLK